MAKKYNADDGGKPAVHKQQVMFVVQLIIDGHELETKVDDQSHNADYRRYVKNTILYFIFEFVRHWII